jgi:hypothetical protein
MPTSRTAVSAVLVSQDTAGELQAMAVGRLPWRDRDEMMFCFPGAAPPAGRQNPLAVRVGGTSVMLSDASAKASVTTAV